MTTTTTEPREARHLRDDAECQTDASRFLAEVMHADPDDLCWDDVHHLQGHAHCAGGPLVVIASRDDSHRTLVLTLEDWESIRRSDNRDRPSMLRACAIESHARLLEAIAAC